MSEDNNNSKVSAKEIFTKCFIWDNLYDSDSRIFFIYSTIIFCTVTALILIDIGIGLAITLIAQLNAIYVFGIAGPLFIFQVTSTLMMVFIIMIIKKLVIKWKDTTHELKLDKNLDLGM